MRAFVALSSSRTGDHARERSTVKVILFLTQDGIEDPDEEPFEAPAQVMWAAEQEAGRFVAGVRFGALSPAQSTQLERFLAVLER